MFPPIVKDLLQLGNTGLLIVMAYRLSIFSYQHKLMWKDFARKKGIDENGGTLRVAGE